MKVNIAVANFFRWSRSDLAGVFFAVIAGFLVCWYLFGLDILWIYNWGWMLSKGDYPSFFLGWDIWRQSPWQFPMWFYSFSPPVGFGPVYTDSIPLAALLGKLFSVVIPGRWQYFGLWLYLCFMLQGYWGYRLAALFTPSMINRMQVVLLLLLAPPLVYRHCHLSLCCHWLLLLLLWLYFQSSELPLRKVLVMLAATTTVAALIHPYIVIMVLALAVAILFRLVVGERRLGWAFGILYLIGLVVITVVCWYGTGAFMIKPLPMTRDGWGYYSLNLNALFNPLEYSNLLPSLPVALGQYEGFNYLGLGGIVLLIVALLTMVRNWRPIVKKHGRMLLPLSAVLLGLTLLSVSCTVAWNQYILIDLRPLPSWLQSCSSQFRSSGRLFWPVYYALFLGCIFLLLNQRRRISVLLSLVVLIQLIDLSYVVGRSLVIKAEPYHNGLDNPVWQDLFRQYRHFFWVGGNGSSLMRNNDSFDFILRMNPHFNSINQFPAARYDLAMLRKYVGVTESLKSGRLESEMLYCLGPRTSSDIVAGARKGGASFFIVDEYLLAARQDDRKIMAEQGELRLLSDFCHIHSEKPLLLLISDATIKMLPEASRQSLLTVIPELRKHRSDVLTLILVDTSPRRVEMLPIPRSGNYPFIWQGEPGTFTTDASTITVSVGGELKITYPFGGLLIATKKGKQIFAECFDQMGLDWKIAPKSITSNSASK